MIDFYRKEFPKGAIKVDKIGGSLFALSIVRSKQFRASLSF
jgi:hypothetical protein